MNKIKKSLVLLVVLIISFGLGSCDLLWLSANQTGLSQALGATLLAGDYLIKESSSNNSGPGWTAEVGEENTVITLNKFDLKTTGAEKFEYYVNAEPDVHALVKGNYILTGKFTVTTDAEKNCHVIVDCESLTGSKVEETIKYYLSMKGKTNENGIDEKTLVIEKFTYNDSDKTSALNNILDWIK